MKKYGMKKPKNLANNYEFKTFIFLFSHFSDFATKYIFVGYYDIFSFSYFVFQTNFLSFPLMYKLENIKDAVIRDDNNVKQN